MPEQLPPAVLDLWHDTPTGAAPVDEIVRAGRRARARRRGLTATLCAAAVAVVVTVSVMTLPGTHRDAAGGPPVAAKPSTTAHALPPKTRLLGYSGLTVTVPDSWMVATGPLCATPKRSFIVFVTDAVYSCPRISNEPTVPVSSLGVGSRSVMHLPGTGWTSTTSRSGVAYEHTAARCATGLCEQAYRVPGTQVAFTLSVTAADRALLREIPASLAPLAAGQVAVPYFDPGADFPHVAAIFRSAGLLAVPGRTAAQPPTPMRSSPAAGTVVRSGSKVTVLMF